MTGHRSFKFVILFLSRFFTIQQDVTNFQVVRIGRQLIDRETAVQQNTFITPRVVLNYGIARNWEIVGEFEVEKAPGKEVQLTDPGLFLKAILKEGILQKKDGVSFAIEVGPLLPATVAGERRFGFEGIGILSGKLASLTYHVNVGGGVDRTKTNPFAIWGVIVELPVLANFRLVGEVSGENIRKKFPDAPSQAMENPPMVGPSTRDILNRAELSPIAFVRSLRGTSWGIRA